MGGHGGNLGASNALFADMKDYYRGGALLINHKDVSCISLCT